MDLHRCLLLASCLLCSWSALAGVRLSPAIMFLDLPNRYLSLTLTNEEPVSMEVSLSVVHWPLPGMPRQTGTPALVAYPAVTNIPARSEQVVRLAYEGGKLEQPLPLRVLFKQRPSSNDAPDGITINSVAFGLGGSFPAFVNPEKAQPGVLIERLDAVTLKLTNQGTAVAYVSGLQSLQRRERPASLFVLPGHSRKLALPADELTGQIRVEKQGWLKVPAP